MNWRDVIGFLLLAVAVNGVLIGLGAVLRDMPIGWLAFVLGIGAGYISYALMRTRAKLPQPEV